MGSGCCGGTSRKSMNIYFLEDGDGVVQFDAGSKAMAKEARAAGAAAGRGEAGRARTRPRRPPRHRALDGRPGLLPPRRSRRRRKRRRDRPLHGPLAAAGRPARWIYPLLLRRWDGGAVKIAGTVSEGDEVAGFRVDPLPRPRAGPDRALARERPGGAGQRHDLPDRLGPDGASRCPQGEASVPHPAWAWDHAKAKESVRKLAALEPAVVGAGHDEPLRGENLRETLERAAEKY